MSTGYYIVSLGACQLLAKPSLSLSEADGYLFSASFLNLASKWLELALLLLLLLEFKSFVIVAVEQL